jgi:hypothetical protein
MTYFDNAEATMPQTNSRHPTQLLKTVLEPYDVL